MIGIFLLFFISANTPEIVEDGIKDGIKTVSNGSVFISAKVVEHCSYKPDIDENGTLNDGYKICEAIIEEYNPNKYPLETDIFKFLLDKSVDVKGQKYDYYFSNQSELYSETMLNDSCFELCTEISLEEMASSTCSVDCSYQVERRRFVNWILLPKDKLPPIHNNTYFAYKIAFEFPQYESARYDLEISYKKLVEVDNKEIDILLDPDISACGTLDTVGATYTLTSDITNVNGDCFVLDANSVTLNLMGYTIRGHPTQGANGVYSAWNFVNLTVKNGTIDDFQYGVQLFTISSSTIESLTVTSSSQYGIYLHTNSDHNVIKNNVVTGNGYGIRLYSDVDNNTLTNNTVNNNPNYGVIIYSGADDNILINNTVNNNGWGIIIYSNADDNTLTNNTANNNTEQGFLLDSGADNNTLTNNTANSNSQGFRLFASSNNNTFTNNIANNNVNLGFLLYSDIDNNTLIGNTANGNINGFRFDLRVTNTTLINNTANENSAYGIYWSSDSDNNTVENLTLYNNTDSGIVLSNSDNNQFSNVDLETVYDSYGDGVIVFVASSNNLIQDSTFVTNQTTLINFTSGSSANNTFLNCTYNQSKEDLSSGGELIRKWYVDVQVNNSLGTAINQANISGYNVSDYFIFSVLTNTSGTIASQSLIEYINNGGTRTYHTNHTINVSKTGFTTNTTTYNLTTENNIDYNVALADSGYPSLSIVHPKPQAYSYNSSLSLNYTYSDSETAVDSCWYKLVNSTNGLIIANTTLASCANSTFDISQGSGIYNITLYANDSEDNLGFDVVTFSVSLDAPAIVLDAPTDDVYLDDGTSVSFNFTATDGDGLDACKLWGNWTGTWHNNFTWVGPTTAVQNNTLVNVMEGTSIWNVWCNDTTTQEGWALNNFTITVDETNPNVTITTANETIITGLSIDIYYNISDININDCYFTLKTSEGLLHNYPENTSLSCSLPLREISTTSYGTFVIQFWGEDKSGNLGDANLTFITRESGPGAGGGGGDVSVEEEEEKTFCGDGVCQLEGNDYGIKEDFWNCPSDCEGFDFDVLIYSITKYCWDADSSTVCFWTQMLFTAVPFGENITVIEPVCGDGVCELNENFFNCEEDCGGFNMDTLVTNCFDGDDTTPCFFNTNLAFVGLFGLGAMMLSLSFVRVRAPGKTKKVNPYKYVVLKYKRRKRRR